MLPADHHRDCHLSTCPEVAYQAAWPAGSSGAQHIYPPQLAWPEPALQQGWLPGSGSKKEVSPAGTCGVVTSSSLPGPSWGMVWAGVGRMYLPRQEREACELCPSLFSHRSPSPRKEKDLAQRASCLTFHAEKCLSTTAALSPEAVPESLRSFLPVSKAEESVGRVCRDRLRPVFMSLFNSRGEPIQFGSSQLLFPEWLRRVGLVGALIARSYICNTREDPGHIPALLLLPPSRHFSSPIKFKKFFVVFVDSGTRDATQVLVHAG